MAAEPQVYELLAQALIYPGEDFAARVLMRVDALSAETAWAEALAAALNGFSTDALQTEHTRLFVNAYGGAPCLPYESVYAEGRMLGEIAAEVAAFYADWGVHETAELPDHAAVELAFAAQLARLRQLPDIGENRDAVAEALEAFERAHLRTWLPALAADMQASAELSFYKATGSALAAVFGAGQARGRAGRAGRPGDLFLDMTE